MPATIRNQAGRALALAVIALLVVADVGTGLDRLSATTPGWERFVPGPFAANAWRTRALAAIRRGDVPAARQAAEAAVRRGPVEPADSALLGSAFLLGADSGAADRAFRVAGQMGWRDAATQVYWLSQSLGLGDYRVAAMRLDAFLRQNPEMTGAPAVMAAFETGPARSALVGKLSSGPPWAPDYIRNVGDLAPAELQARGEIVTAVARGGGRPAGCQAVGPLVDILVLRGLAGGADAVWRSNCPGQSNGLIGDGDFIHWQSAGRDSLFSWWATGDSDVSVLTAQQKGSPGAGLAISSGSPFTRDVVGKLLYLPEGRYRLRWQAVAQDGRATDRIVAALGCAPTGGDPLAAHAIDAAGMNSAEIAVDRACPAHWLVFRVKPGGGEVRLAKVDLVRAG